MIKRAWLKWCFTAFLVLAISPAQAEQELEVLTENWAPFNYEKDQKVTGYSTEIVEAVLAEAKIPYKIRLGVWKGVYLRALDTPNVLIYTITRTADREDKFHWIGPIADRKQSLYKLKTRSDIQATELEHVKNYRLVLQEEDAIVTFFLDRGFTEDSPNFNLFPKKVKGLKMLYADRVDIIPAHPLSIKHDLTTQGYDPQEVIRVLDLDVGGAYYMAFSKGSDKALISKTQSAFDRLQKNGTIQAIRASYSFD